VRAADQKTLVIMTIYSPFMMTRMLSSHDEINRHLKTNPDAVRVGLEIMTENVLEFVRGCKDVGIDGFYISTQGGEAARFPDSDIFSKYIKPTDLAVWAEAESCPFNILHICDYELPYDDLSPFLDYPGHVVNSSLHGGDKTYTPRELSEYFGRPFMGGMERKKTIATGTADEIRQEVKQVLQNIPDRFILGADCTVPSETPWENLRTAIATAHQFKA
jgi:uroporphyrinogen decarboxylase